MHRRVALLFILGLLCAASTSQAPAQGTPPTIVFHPTNRVASIGGAASFIVTASGSNLVYRWRKEGIPLANGTNRLLSLVNLSNGNAGAYTVVVTNFFGSVTSQPAFLTLTGQPPRIFLQPTNSLVCPGGVDAILRVQSSGSPPFTYQWLRDGEPVPGQTFATFQIPSSPTAVGNYSVIVANGYGSDTSQVARLSLGPIITQQPLSQIAQAGSNVLFQVNAVACTSASYQWRFNGVNIPDGTNAGLYYRSPDIQHEGNYDVVVSDNFRSLTSAVAHLTVLRYPPLIFNQPIDFIETFSTNILFAVTYGGAPLPTFQWYHDGVAIPSENDRLLRFMAYPWLQGDYWVVLSNSIGSVTSRVARFTLPQIQPILLTPPASIAYCPELTYEQPPVLFVDAVSLGAVPTYYQWFREGVAVPGATNATLFIAGIPEPFGRYTVEVSNFAGITSAGTAVVSYAVSIEVDPPFEQTVIAGSSAAFTAEVTACGPYTLQWRKDGADLPGQTNSVLYIDPVSPEDAGNYTLVATYQSTSNTRNLQLHVEPFDPVIYDGEPLDQTVNAGEYVFLNFQYEIGFPHADIQWHFNGRPIPGETNDTLQFLALSPAQQGRYSVTLSNVSAVVTSRQARVLIHFTAPFFDLDPEDIETEANGATVQFYAFAFGAPPPSYQWLFNDRPLRFETNDVLSVPFRQLDQAGGYSIVASNLLGAVTSRVATLTAILSPPTFLSEPEDQTVDAGHFLHLHGLANGSPEPAYQWLFNGVPIPGEREYNLYFSAGFSNQIGGYSLVASNAVGMATSRVAQIDILLRPPEFTTHPIPQQLVVGESLHLNFFLSNQVPAHIQWQRDGENAPNATTYSFVIRAASTNDAGDYRAIAFNDVGIATSQIAKVEVRIPGSLDRWTWRRSLPQGNHLYSSAYGNGRYVAIGEAGAVVVSTNGTDWIELHRPEFRFDLRHLCFGNGKFVAYNYNVGRFVCSTNGVDWADGELQVGQWIERIAFGNGRFVACDYERRTYVSTNGIDWEVRLIEDAFIQARAPGLQDWFLHEIFFAHDRFIASFQIYPGLHLYGVLTSTNGLDWQSSIIPNPELADIQPINAVAFGNDRYVALMAYDPFQVLISTNGQDWSIEILPTPMPFSFFQSMTFGAGRFVRSDYGNGLSGSVDGLNWTTVTGVSSNTLSQVNFQDNRFVAVGDNGALITSTNGIGWLEHNPGSGLNLRGITRADGLFVTVGNEGLIYTSANGRDWNRQDPGTNINLRAVTYFKGRYIAVGEQETLVPSERVTIYTSPDAIQWQPAVSVGTSGYGNLYSMAHNEHTIVAVGDGSAVAVSQDGLIWSDAVGLPIVRDLNAAIWSGSAFYAAGKDGTVLTSTNGINWLSIGPGGGRNLHGIAYGNGVFVTVANGGRYFVGSGDGSWQRHDWRSTEDLSDIIFAGGRFIAVGDNGTMHTSTDGTNWTRRVNPSGNDLRSIIYSEGSYWVVGNNETILQSFQIDPALRIHRITGSADVALELLGEAGASHRLQGSHNFNDWTDILSFTAGPEPRQYRTADPNTGGWRFYRVVRP